MKKQDLNGVRTAQDVERRHNLGAIPQLEEDVSNFTVDETLSSSSTHAVANKAVTQGLNSLNTNKVDKVTGKGLSSNDFTNADKLSIHTHSNKSVLDLITLEKMNAWDNNTNYNVYSTSEIVVGTWLGKPLYRKMVDFGTLPNNTLKDVAHNLQNIRHIHVNIGESVWCQNNQNYDEGGMHSPVHSWFINIEVATDNIRIQTNTDASGWHMLVCLEYTKTTD